MTKGKTGKCYGKAYFYYISQEIHHKGLDIFTKLWASYFIDEIQFKKIPIILERFVVKLNLYNVIIFSNCMKKNHRITLYLV